MLVTRGKRKQRVTDLAVLPRSNLGWEKWKNVEKICALLLSLLRVLVIIVEYSKLDIALEFL